MDLILGRQWPEDQASGLRRSFAVTQPNSRFRHCQIVTLVFGTFGPMPFLSFRSDNANHDCPVGPLLYLSVNGLLAVITSRKRRLATPLAQ